MTIPWGRMAEALSVEKALLEAESDATARSSQYYPRFYLQQLITISS